MGVPAVIQRLPGRAGVDRCKENNPGQFLKVIQYVLKVIRLDMLKHIDAGDHFTRYGIARILRHPYVIGLVLKVPAGLQRFR